MDPAKRLREQDDNNDREQKGKWDAAVTRQNKAGVIWAFAFWPLLGLAWWISRLLGFIDQAFFVFVCMAIIGYIAGFVVITKLFYKLPPSE